jgi:hypothetical protein
VEPLCFVSSNKKGDVISFISLRLVMELLALLSGYLEKVFKRMLPHILKGTYLD